MWFCIKCGKSVPKEELIRGYCLSCFLSTVSILKYVPEIKIITCPKCGSWLHQGEWNPPAPENEILEIVARRELEKYLIEGATLREVSVNNFEYVNFNVIKFNATLILIVDGKSLNLDQGLLAKISHRLCSRCIARSVGKHSYLVQIRFTENEHFEILKEVMSTLLIHINQESLVNVRESREGVDLELDDSVLVKKILEVLSSTYAARISTSFRATRYNAHQGKWIGVTTYVARIPVFKENSVVIYRDRIGLVKSMNRGKLTLWLPDTNLYEEVDVREYWRGGLKYATRVEREIYVVKSIDSNTLLLENPLTGEVKRVKRKGWLKNLKEGDTVNLIKVDNFETFAPKF